MKDEQVSLAGGEEKRISDALAALAKDPHAPRQLTVTLNLHIHNEYPKHVVVGKDKDGVDVVKVAGSEAEEDAILASIAPPAVPAQS